MPIDKITISGHEIQVRHDTSIERLQRLASWIDKLIREKKEKFGNISIMKSVLLVALDLADQLDSKRFTAEKEIAERAQHLIQEIKEVI
jgi:cell division protein ZapA (FtsZ GTPase activity inhibitor)